MKKNLFLFAFLLLSLVGKAQDSLVHTGELMQIAAGQNVYMMGNFTDLSTTLVVANEGTVHLQGNLRNNGSVNIFGPATTGTLRFFGGSAVFNASIFGANPINLWNLKIDLANPALIGNVLLRNNTLNASGAVSFLSGGFDLDDNVFNLVHNASFPGAGIIAESNTARPLLLTDNPDGKIVLLNYPFSSGLTYYNVKGMGLGFHLVGSLGGSSSTLTRTFQSQPCGDSVGRFGSIQRVFRMEGNTNAPLFTNANIKFLNPSELAGNDQDSLRISVSEDRGQVWRQRINNTGSIDSVTSDGTTLFSSGTDYTAITAATYPCNGMDSILINQIITGVTPNDTLFSIDSAISCSSSVVNVQLYATGEVGAYFEWRNASTYSYSPQNGPGYFNATALGTYWVRMTNIRGCMDSLSIVVVPVAPGNSAIAAHAPQICLGSSITFNPAVPVGTSTYAWDFGDGATASTSSASHLYATNGTYTITLSVTTAQGCLSSSTSSIQVNAFPVVSFATSPACPGIPINFDNNTTVVSLPTFVSLNWNFGDLTIDSSTANTSGTGGSGDIIHSYVSGGSYSVTLTATANGCTATSTQTVTVYPSPVASFTFGPACQGSNVAFTNTSTISPSTALSYLWDFTGVGPTSSTQDPSYSYGPTATGTYNVTLTTTSTNGCVSDTTQTISISSNPIASFTAANACESASATSNSAIFTNTTPSVGTPPFTYAWNFGDGNSGTLLNESNSYLSPGTYTVSLIVTSATGCLGSVTNSVVIFPNPTVGFSALNACANVPINFTNTTTGAVSYLWNFPSISTSATSTNTTQTFSTSGTFPVTLTATSSNSCQAIYNDSITIDPLPVLSLGGSITTCGTTYTLDASPGGINAGSSFSWNTLATTPSIITTLDGTYTVTVVSPLGCVNSESVTVALNGVVMPTLGPDAVACDNTILDAGYPSALTTYAWSTGASTQTIFVTTTGTYSVTVTDQNGCVGTNTVNITIVPSTPVSLGMDTIACASTGVLLNAGTAATYLWSDGSSAATLQVPATGYYWVQITNSGCSSSDTIQVTLNASPIFSLGPDAIACDQLLLNGFMGSGYSYYWNTTDITPSITVTSSANYDLTITNNLTSCSSKDTVGVTINPLPIVYLGNDTILCSYQTITIDAGNSGSSFLWNSGPTTQTISVAATGLYEVTVTDANSCSSTDQMLVTIRPVFTIDLGPDKQYCPGSTLILDAGLTTTGNTYLWENNSTTLATTATYTVADTGMYYLTVQDSYNCTANDSVDVLPSNTSLYAVFLAQSEIVQGESVVFVNLSYPRPYTSTWYLNNILVSNDSSPTIAFTMPISPPSDTIYATLKVSNGMCTSIRTKPIKVSSPFSPISLEDNKPAKPDEEVLFTQINQVNLYPNPNSGVFNFAIDISKEAYAYITIYSISGTLVYSEKRFVSSGIIPYDLNELNAGMYFFSIEIFNEKRTLKFIKIQN